jgi:hypothetical protein
MSEKVSATCAECGKAFYLGWTGVCPNGIPLCDMCGLGYERESIGRQQARSCFWRAYWPVAFVVCCAIVYVALRTLGR